MCVPQWKEPRANCHFLYILTVSKAKPAQLSFEGFYVVVAHVVEAGDLLEVLCKFADKAGVTGNKCPDEACPWFFPQKVGCGIYHYSYCSSLFHTKLGHCLKMARHQGEHAFMMTVMQELVLNYQSCTLHGVHKLILDWSIKLDLSTSTPHWGLDL